MCETNLVIVFTSSEPSLALIYDTKTGLHSVYKIRKASQEECQQVCGPVDTTVSMYNRSINDSFLNLGGSNISTNKSFLGRTPLNLLGKDNNNCHIYL